MIDTSTGKRLPSGASRQLEPLVQDPRLAGLDVAGQPRPVLLAQLRRDDQLGQLVADRLVTRVAEGLLRGRAEVEHATAMVHRDHAVERDSITALFRAPLRSASADASRRSMY